METFVLQIVNAFGADDQLPVTRGCNVILALGMFAPVRAQFHALLPGVRYIHYHK